jgi:hypothetical protein
MIDSSRTGFKPSLLKTYVIVLLAISWLFISASAQEWPFKKVPDLPLESIAGVGSDILDQFPSIERVGQVSMLDNTVGVCFFPGSTYKSIAYDIESERYVAFTSGYVYGPPIFFNHGAKFLTATRRYSEGPLTYTIYDLQGVASHQLTVKAPLAASETGKYFYTNYDYMTSPSPVVYDSTLTPLPDFPIKYAGSFVWHAAMIGDSLYIFQQDDEVRLYDLDSRQLIKALPFDWCTGMPMSEFFCNETGTLCAITLLECATLLNTVTGFYQVIDADARYVYMTPSGNTAYLLDPIQHKLAVRKYEFDGTEFTLRGSCRIPSSDIIPGGKALVLHSFYEISDGLVISFLIGVPGAEPEGQVHSIILPTEFSERATPEVRLLGGPSWVRTDDTSRVLYTLDIFSNPDTVVIQQTVDATFRPGR